MKFLLPVTFLITCLFNSKVEARWKPKIGTTWNYVLNDDLGFDVAKETAEVVDIDYETSTEVINKLHKKNISVICYFSVGTFEDFRDDADDFLAIKDLVRDPYVEWEGEYWLDYRVKGLKNLIEKHGYLTEPSKWENPLTVKDTIDYAIWLAETAHKKNLSIGLKNIPGTIDKLGSYFDFAINESCVNFDECYLYENFLKSGKPVFGVTYYGLTAENKERLCRNLYGLPISMIIKENRELYQDVIFFNGKETCGKNFDTGL
ncbi:hypothetical protein BCR32DRAFT_247298 [Anaeromyces robustus]|uniref:alpha-galactosidase n=1 Tax=Anaeromyces robustus TaxID=1754192 RepID=A0A1Y1WXL7_9FUNG|nr:hypothetical protein BCR32DRAFT_247298 [Anaeromyces robustus]|eukprot:ORX78290.1 hypothetical protein BCR32DRAFT_247298 [Anaeromyces robustus]